MKGRKQNINSKAKKEEAKRRKNKKKKQRQKKQASWKIIKGKKKIAIVMGCNIRTHRHAL